MHITNLRAEQLGYTVQQIIRLSADGKKVAETRTILQEVHLPIILNGTQILQLVCTPQALPELILGRLFVEGFLSNPNEIISMTISETEARVVTQTPSANDPANDAPLVPFPWKMEWIFTLIHAFQAGAPLYQATHGIHSCFLMHDGRLRACFEDLGRHNAMDKAIGYALLQGIPLDESVLFTSGRVPTEIMRKIIRARVPVLISNAVPTDKAVALARQHHVTLLCTARPEGMDCFSGEDLWT